MLMLGSIVPILTINSHEWMFHIGIFLPIVCLDETDALRELNMVLFNLPELSKDFNPIGVVGIITKNFLQRSMKSSSLKVETILDIYLNCLLDACWFDVAVSLDMTSVPSVCSVGNYSNWNLL